MGSRLEQKSSEVRKRIENHKRIQDETGDEYSQSSFGGWGEYFRRKKIKLQNLDAERRASSTKPQIFKGVVCHVTGYTQPSLQDLHNLVVDHGGGFIQYLDGKTMVTHIIASSLTPKKRVEFKAYRIVKPAWIVESVNMGILQPWHKYRVMDEGTGQKVLSLQDGSFMSQVNTQKAGYRDQTDTSWYTSQVQDHANRLERDYSIGEISLPGPLKQKAEIDESAVSDGSEPDPQDGEQVEREGNQEAGAFERPLNWSHVVNAKADLKDSFGFSDGDLDDIVVGETRNKSQPDVLDICDPPKQDGLTSALSLTPPLAMSGDLAEVVNNIPSLPKPGHEMTAAELHNVKLLSDPKTRKSTVVDPGFLKQYYAESRLHHLSAWKAELKSKLQAMAVEMTLSQKAKQKAPKGARRYIFHVDFDCFFAAISLIKHPQWKDKPAVVAHGAGSGAEIASCNYPAREFGVKNGMWMKTAQQLCPDLKVMPYDFKAYEAASKEFYDVIMSTSGVVQSVSIDEALIDLSMTCFEAAWHDGKGTHKGSIYQEQAKADEIAQSIRDQIKSRTGCAVSVGVGGNVLLAKAALRRAKPAGQYQVKPEEVLDFIGALTVQELPGVAYSIGGKLEDIGIKSVKDIRELNREKLIMTLGPKTGQRIWDYSRGIDKTEVGEQVIRKSVSAEVNWGVRFVTQEQADEFVQSLCEELAKRLVNEAVKGRQLTMKIMRRAQDVSLSPPKHLGHGKCDTFNKSIALNVGTNDGKILGREAISILRGFGIPPAELRGIGCQVTKLEPINHPAASSPLPSSQKRLHFKSPVAPASRSNDDHIQDDGETVKHSSAHPAAHLSSREPGNEKRALLNTTGTQFLIPTQTDPTVLAELPSEIRARLQAKSKPVGVKPPVPLFKQELSTSKPNLRPTTPAEAVDVLPSESQLDPDTLAALPEDVRAEVLGFYHKSPTTNVKGQSVLPQSPRKNRSIKRSLKKTTPTKKRTGKSTSSYQHSTLTQSNFVTGPSVAHGVPLNNIPEEDLDALPEDIRAEVLAEQRRERHKRRAGLDLAAKKRAMRPTDDWKPRIVELEPRPPPPTFSDQKLSDLSELRSTIADWVADFGAEEPSEEDVDALGQYLKKVVVEEENLSKAAGVVQWLIWCIDNEPGGEFFWKGMVDRIKNWISDGMRERGLGDLRFD